jgi:hypothetical protein
MKYAQFPWYTRTYIHMRARCVHVFTCVRVVYIRIYFNLQSSFDELKAPFSQDLSKIIVNALYYIRFR